jgi:transketolase
MDELTTESTLGLEAALRCKRIRQRIVGLSYQARSAHLGSSLSCVEILDAILSTSNIRKSTIRHPDRDRLVFSKGHAAMAFYSALEVWGLLDSCLLEDYLKDGSTLWGHVTRSEGVPAIDASTGSLGHGLGLAIGFALGYRLRGYAGRIFCVLSDGDCDEGSTWEAALFAGHHHLHSVTAVIDHNKVQSIGTTTEVLDLEPFAAKWEAFGWSVNRIDGHDHSTLIRALHPLERERPCVIIADTVKGKGIPRIEHTVASHYHPAKAEDLHIG